MELELLWRRISPARNISMAFSEDGLLGVSSFCSIYNKEGKRRKACEYDTISVSYCCDTFAFLSKVFGMELILVDKRGNVIGKRKLHSLTYGVGFSNEGFLVCGGGGCKLYDMDWNEVWGIHYNYIAYDRPAYYKGYWYIPTFAGFVIIKARIAVRERKLPHYEQSLSVDVCDKYLALSTESHIHLFELDDPLKPKMLWMIKGIAMPLSIAFSPDCKYIAVAENDRHRLRIYDLNGNLVFKRRMCCVGSVAWWQDRLAVGIENKAICMYKVNEEAPFEGPKKEDACTNLSPI